MASGAIYADSVYPATVTGEVFGDLYTAKGANSPNRLGWGIEASLGADATLECEFQIATTLPSGTLKIIFDARADAETGVAKLDVQWRSVAPEEDPSDTALNAEGTQTVTWATADDDVKKELKVTLDADTVVGGETIVLNVVFETTSWTLAAKSNWKFWLEFED